MRQKLVLIENHHEQDIPKGLLQLLETPYWKKKYEVELWCNFSNSYWPDNRKATLKRLAGIDTLIARHVFVDWCQLEIFIKILIQFMDKGKKITFFLYHPDLLETFNKWYDAYEAYSTPDTDEYNDDPDLREFFKKMLNKQFLAILDFHKICEVNDYYDKNKYFQRIRSKDISK